MLHQAGIRPEDWAAGRITPPKLHNLTNALTSLARRPLWVRRLLPPLTLWPCSRTRPPITATSKALIWSLSTNAVDKRLLPDTNVPMARKLAAGLGLFLCSI